jgi:virginiamycin B lyase
MPRTRHQRATLIGLLAGLVAGLGAMSAEAAPAGQVTEWDAGPLILPYDIVAGPDGNLWYTKQGDYTNHGQGAIGRITPTGVVTEFTAGIPAGTLPFAIVVGPDGNLWFTENDGDSVARITPSGVVTRFTAGITANAKPGGIVVGPDGNLWFTERGGVVGRIGRITTAGVVTEFSAGITAGSQPARIAVGPDGNLWFTERAANRIARITTAGVVTEFSAGITAGALLGELVTGPDGNLWFVEEWLHRIGRITTAGVVTEFSAGITPGSFPNSIDTGPDGGLWFTERIGRRIGRMATTGVATELAITPALTGEPYSITLGPDGDMWFTEPSYNQIGRITTRATPECSTATVTGVSPAAAPPGSAVAIAGAGFGCATGVRFGDEDAAAFTIDGDGQITARTPPQAPGDVDLRVLTSAGAGATAARFTVLPDLLSAIGPDAVPAIAPARALRCGRMPTLTGRTLGAARRILRRDGCAAAGLDIAGSRPRRRHRRVTSQRPRPGTPIYAGDPRPSVRFA